MSYLPRFFKLDSEPSPHGGNRILADFFLEIAKLIDRSDLPSIEQETILSHLGNLHQIALMSNHYRAMNLSVLRGSWSIVRKRVPAAIWEGLRDRDLEREHIKKFLAGDDL